MGHRLWSFLISTLACAAACRADTVTLTPDRDNTLFQSSAGNLSDGAGIAFYAGRSNQAAGLEIRRGLMHFNLASIPAGATITSASLRLVSENIGQNGNRTMILHRTLQDWGQGTSNSSGSGATATTNDATWLYRFFVPANPTTSPAWTTLGGSFEKTDSATAICPNLGGAFTFNSSITMISDLQGWLANPSTNFGWEILGDEGTQGTAKKIYSRENSLASNRPALTITYVVPEPTGLLLLILAISILPLRAPRHPLICG
ncbi:MAG TPA: DNRLRE domain-containing protein [Tepidisphaeraceae bacterium]|nr:DNRLRE domain-containing protein [Tepidisphaeraceae bacterium]